MTPVHRQVVVTGVGAVTPIGASAVSTWAAMLAGRCGAARLEQEWAASLPVRIAAQVPPGPPVVAPAGRATQFLLTALREAWTDAGFSGAGGDDGMPPAERIGVSLGTGVGDMADLLPAPGISRFCPPTAGPGRGPSGLGQAGGSAAIPGTAGAPAFLAAGMAAAAGRMTGAGAGVHTFGTACVASGDAIAYGMSMIRRGRADVVVAGGGEAAIHPLSIAAFARISALSRRNDDPGHACRPCDKNRDGFVLGEGAGVLVLESAEHAAARGAPVYCELAGAGHSSDVHHITAPDPDGRGMKEAVLAALADARLAAADVRHVNAHATGTRRGDLAESRALVAALGDTPYCVSATKSMTGHLIGAAAAVEAVAAVLAARDRIAPPTVNLDDPDDAIDLDMVGACPRPLPAGPAAVLSNSAGFGGHNVVLAFHAVS